MITFELTVFASVGSADGWGSPCPATDHAERVGQTLGFRRELFVVASGDQGLLCVDGHRSSNGEGVEVQAQLRTNISIYSEAVDLP